MAARTKLEQHEEICALRYEGIEKRLDSGADKFKRIENMVWGIYVLIIGSQVIGVML